MFLGSVKKSSDLNPPSLPNPELFIPPNGILKSLSSHVLIHITPESIFAATLWALLTFSVNILADKPYLVELAILITSSSVLNGIIDTTGPNISCWLIEQL